MMTGSHVRFSVLVPVYMTMIVFVAHCAPAVPAPRAAPRAEVTVDELPCDALSAEIGQRIARAIQCTTDRDCTRWIPSPCGLVVHRDADAAAIEAHMEEYERRCSPDMTDYDCRAGDSPRCREGECVLIDTLSIDPPPPPIHGLGGE